MAFHLVMPFARAIAVLIPRETIAVAKSSSPCQEDLLGKILLDIPQCKPSIIHMRRRYLRGGYPANSHTNLFAHIMT
jgi:hypothetical protein